MIKKITLFLTLSTLMFSCSIFKKDANEDQGLKKKVYEPNMDKRMAQDKERGITLFGKDDRSSFGKQNAMWRATLKSLENIPISVVSYEGGLITTDWYSTNNSNDSIKIQINFLSDEIASSSIQVQIFKKECKVLNKIEKCNVSMKEDGTLASGIKNKILNNVRKESLQRIKK